MIEFLVLNKKKGLHLKHCVWRGVGNGWLFDLISPSIWVPATEMEVKWNIRDSAGMSHSPGTAVKFQANEN